MKDSSIFKPEFMKEAIKGSFIKLNPVSMLRSPVMFVVEIGSTITTFITIYSIIKGQPYLFNLQITLWLWFTCLFGNLAEAVAEGRGKNQAASLKKTRKDTEAKKLEDEKQMLLQKLDNIARQNKAKEEAKLKQVSSMYHLKLTPPKD